jgi:Fe-S oxidoreductase
VYDPRARRAARAAVRLLGRAGFAVALLGQAEVCCGDLALRAGRPDLAASLAERNLAALGATGATLVATSSPHCRQAFETWYPGAGRPTARHVVELLADALDGGRLQLGGSFRRRVAYHDPCYLGRHAGVYEAPRALLRAVPGLELVELPRSRESSLCCGGGGGGAWRETAREERHAVLRVDEALGAGVEVLATACPLCLLMLEDAVKVTGLEERLKVVDLCEILWAAAESEAG